MGTVLIRIGALLTRIGTVLICMRILIRIRNLAHIGKLTRIGKFNPYKEFGPNRQNLGAIFLGVEGRKGVEGQRGSGYGCPPGQGT